MKTATTYKTIQQTMLGLVNAFDMMSGDDLADTGATFDSLARDAADMCDSLASQLREASRGNHEALFCVPSFADFYDED